MSSSRMLFVMAIGLSAAACSTTTYTTTQAAAPAGPIVVTGSEQACMDYGFTAGTVAYDRCVSREHEARLRGRVVLGYSEAQPVRLVLPTVWGPVPAPMTAASAARSTPATIATARPRSMSRRPRRPTPRSIRLPATTPRPRRRPTWKAGMRIPPAFRPLGTSMVSAMMPKVTGSIGTGTSSARSRRSPRGIDGGTACVDLCSCWPDGHGVQRRSAEA